MIFKKEFTYQAELNGLELVDQQGEGEWRVGQ
jgi:hypothetical protein